MAPILSDIFIFFCIYVWLIFSPNPVHVKTKNNDKKWKEAEKVKNTIEDFWFSEGEEKAGRNTIWRIPRMFPCRLDSIFHTLYTFEQICSLRLSLNALLEPLFYTMKWRNVKTTLILLNDFITGHMLVCAKIKSFLTLFPSRLIEQIYTQTCTCAFALKIISSSTCLL